MKNPAGTGRVFAQSSWSGRGLQSAVNYKLSKLTSQGSPPGQDPTSEETAGSGIKTEQDWCIRWTSGPQKQVKIQLQTLGLMTLPRTSFRQPCWLSIALGSLLGWPIWTQFCSLTLVTLSASFVFTILVHHNFPQLVLVLPIGVNKEVSFLLHVMGFEYLTIATQTF